MRGLPPLLFGPRFVEHSRGTMWVGFALPPSPSVAVLITVLTVAPLLVPPGLPPPTSMPEKARTGSEKKVQRASFGFRSFDPRTVPAPNSPPAPGPREDTATLDLFSAHSPTPGPSTIPQTPFLGGGVGLLAALLAASTAAWTASYPEATSRRKQGCKAEETRQS